jgi:hypothetical protein
LLFFTGVVWKITFSEREVSNLQPNERIYQKSGYFNKRGISILNRTTIYSDSLFKTMLWGKGVQRRKIIPAKYVLRV